MRIDAGQLGTGGSQRTGDTDEAGGALVCAGCGQQLAGRTHRRVATVVVRSLCHGCSRPG